MLVDEAIRDRTITLPSDHGFPEKTLNLEHLRRVMKERVEETLQLIEEELSDRNALAYVRSGIVVCGGGAHILGIDRLAESVFQAPACTGRTCAMSGMKAALDQPEFATAIGLVRFGAMQSRKRKGGGFLPEGIIPQRVKETFENLFRRA